MTGEVSPVGDVSPPSTRPAGRPFTVAHSLVDSSFLRRVWGVTFAMGRGTARNLFRRLYREVTSIVTRPPKLTAGE